MRQLLYVSHVCRDFPPASLDRILAVSRANNAMTGITGLLLHISGGFLHMLEGEERTLRELYARIGADRRHRDLHLLLDREAGGRSFPGWSLGFERPAPDDPETAGMFGVVREAVHGRLAPRAGKVVAVMLETFYRVQREDHLRLADAS